MTIGNYDEEPTSSINLCPVAKITESRKQAHSATLIYVFEIGIIVSPRTNASLVSGMSTLFTVRMSVHGQDPGIQFSMADG